MKKMHAALFITVLLSLVGTSYADLGGKMVDVHLVVFKQATPNTAQNFQGRLVQPKNTGIDLMQSAQNSSSNYQLQTKPDDKSIIKDLTKHGYQVLLNLTWQQPAIQTSTWLHVYGGQAYDAQGQPVSTDPMAAPVAATNDLLSQGDNQDNQLDKQNTSSQISANGSDNPTAKPAKFWQVNGLVRVSYDQRFNINTRLYFTEPVNLNDLSNPAFGLIPLTTYTFYGFQHIQLGQTAYFDHPVYGAIVNVQLAKVV